MEFFSVFIFVFVIGMILLIVSGNRDNEMSSFQARLMDSSVEYDASTSFSAKEVFVKGLFPINHKTNLGIIISLLDKTSGEYQPILSSIDSFQESGSAVFQHIVKLGEMEEGSGFTDWVKVSAVIPEIIQTPNKGEREIHVFVRLVDFNNPPNINHGFHVSKNGVFWQKSLVFNWDFEDSGYFDEVDQQQKVWTLTVRLGVAIAFADRNFDTSEGNVIKRWVEKTIEHYSDNRKIELKELLNKAMKKAFEDAKADKLCLSELASEINDIGEKVHKYEAMELCFEIMAADGIADTEEMLIINSVAKALDLDVAEIEKMRDNQIVNLNPTMSGQVSIETLLGISDDWDKEQVNKHLRVEFQKWNSRLNTLSSDDERANAQKMLDAIAEAKSKYV
jgi:tellurite resistance protein